MLHELTPESREAKLAEARRFIRESLERAVARTCPRAPADHDEEQEEPAPATTLRWSNRAPRRYGAFRKKEPA
jgi:hypothetical protein